VIPCPVTLVIRGRGRKASQERARLVDIGACGASLYSPVPLDVGSDVTLMIEFPEGEGSVRTVQFEGLVTRARAKPLYEAAVVFRRRGRFLRTDIDEVLLRFVPESSPEGADSEAPEGPQKLW